jgi:SAM-dependent methyltransferase
MATDIGESLSLSRPDLSQSYEEKDICQSNMAFYDSVWLNSRIQPPRRFNTWPILSPLAATIPHRLEVGSGLRPGLPIAGTWFVDISQVAVDRLKEAGGLARNGNISDLPFPDQAFDLVCAFDMIEHVSDGYQAFGELCRVLRGDGLLFFSVPIHEGRWTDFDVQVGHYRRYEPHQVQDMIASNHMILEQSAIYGMMPRSRWLVSLGMWFTRYFRRTALLFYDRLVSPMGLHFRQPLALVSGLVDTVDVEEVLFVCRRVSRVREGP